MGLDAAKEGEMGDGGRGNYYIFAAPGLTCLFEFCRNLQKVESLFTKLNNFHGFYVQKIIHYFETKNG